MKDTDANILFKSSLFTYLDKTDYYYNFPDIEDKDYEELYSMILFGVCENGATISTKVNSFNPFFYIKPPESWENYNENVTLIEWPEKVKMVIDNKICLFFEYGSDLEKRTIKIKGLNEKKLNYIK